METAEASLKELNQTIAENVHGWKWTIIIARFTGKEISRLLPPILPSDWDNDCQVLWEYPLPDYATDISLAFDVAEKIGLFRRYMLRQLTTNEWQMIAEENVGYTAISWDVAGSGTTPAEAICRAALNICPAAAVTHSSESRSHG